MPLDHSGATAGTLPLQYAVLAATGPRAGTLVLLTGGPGEQAVGYGDELRRELAPLRAAHDLVLVDQRGTGGSGATRCDPLEFSGDCADKLGAKRPFLTTVERPATSKTCASRSGPTGSRCSACPTGPRWPRSTCAASRTGRPP